jgi:hypothetical protein
MFELPKCPCGSKKPYETCCYLIKLPNGERKYFKGLTTEVDSVWHPLPNKRLKAVIHLKTINEHTKFAEQWLNSKLTEKQTVQLRRNLEAFHKSKMALDVLLQQPGANNVSTALRSPELITSWRSYLENTRILLDTLGLFAYTTMGLKQNVGGFSKKKLPNFRQQLESIKKGSALATLNEISPILLDLIELRNFEKVTGSTILEPPIISPEGIPAGGKLHCENKEIEDMIGFIRELNVAMEAFLSLILQ